MSGLGSVGLAIDDRTRSHGWLLSGGGYVTSYEQTTGGRVREVRSNTTVPALEVNRAERRLIKSSVPFWYGFPQPGGGFRLPSESGWGRTPKSSIDSGPLDSAMCEELVRLAGRPAGRLLAR